jgi:hypothetical protein
LLKIKKNKILFMKQNEQNKYKISQQTWLKCPEWIEIKKIEINLLQVILFFWNDTGANHWRQNITKDIICMTHQKEKIP